MTNFVVTKTENRSVTVKSGEYEVDMNVVESIEVKVMGLEELQDLIPYYTDSWENTQKAIKDLYENGNIDLMIQPYDSSPYYKNLSAFVFP